MKRFITCLLVLVGISQVYGQIPESETRLGIFVRETVFRVSPKHAAEWEAAVRDISTAAAKSNSSVHNWLLYKAGPFVYWMIQFSETLDSIPTEMSFHSAFADLAGAQDYLNALSRLLKTDFEITRDIICQQDSYWSTVAEMSTDTHPKARVSDYWVRPGDEDAFDKLQKQLTSLLVEIGYPFPVESFRPRFGAPRVSQVVTFADSWESFHGANSLDALANEAGKLNELDALRTRRASLVLREVHHDLDFEPSLSYGAE